MATSGTWAFTLDLPEIIEEAYERAGKELRSGWDYRTARKSLDLLLLEWQNRGLNLWAVKNASQTLTAGTASYALSGERLDIIEASLRQDAGAQSQSDLTMTRMSISDYARQTNKLTQGRPTQYFVEYTPSAITVFVWPVPDSAATYVFNYWYMERIEDTGNSGANNVDVPARFLPALTSGLAYQLALKIPDAAPRLQALHLEAERQWDLAADAARDKASFFIRPRIYRN